MIVLMLLYPQICLGYSLTGLQLWFERMIPALFPFMVLSGVIVRMNLTEDIVSIFTPILLPLFHVKKTVIYGILMGFLCGFPMGAKVAVQFYENKKITEQEAEYLLCFCNNIGPIYFLSYVLPTLGIKNVWPYLIGMYGLPLAYGILLRYTLYRNKISSWQGHSSIKSKQDKTFRVTAVPQKKDFLGSLDLSLKDSINSIVVLGGYMIIFNAFNLLPRILLSDYALWGTPMLEITGGIGLLGASAPFYILCLIPFGGLCCMAQTYTIINNTPLKISKYMWHKLVLTIITIAYYLVIL